MAAAQSGASDAYAALLKAVLPRLRAMIRNQRRFLSEADIEDLVQDTLVSLHAVRATYDPAAPSGPGSSRSRATAWPMAPAGMHGEAPMK